MVRQRSRSALRTSKLSITRRLRSEELEPREMLAANVLESALLGASVAAAKVAVNQAPAFAQTVTVNNNQTITGRSASLSVLGKDDGGESKLVYSWSVVATPSGANAWFSTNNSNGAKKTTLNFDTAGTYTVMARIQDAAGLAAMSTTRVVVTQKLTKVNITAAGAAVGGAYTLAGSSQTFAAQGIDQFGNGMSAAPTCTWSISGTPKPTLTSHGASATAAFSKLGTYKLSLSASGNGGSATASTNVVVTALPTAFTVTAVGNVGQITGTTAQFNASVFTDQFRNQSSAPASLSWSVDSAPGGVAAPSFSVSGSSTTVTFHAAGSYAFTVTASDAAGHSLSRSVSCTVVQAAAGLASALVSPGTVAGTSTALTTPALVDQFGTALTSQPGLTWVATSLPNGAAAPAFTANGGSTTVSFTSAGSYTIAVEAAGSSTVLGSTTLSVAQTLTSIAVTPGTATVSQSSSKQFAAQGLDQFQHGLASPPTFTWTTTAGTITSGGLLTTPAQNGNLTVTAHSGNLTATASVTVVTNALGLQDATLGSLVNSLDADNSISRADMMQILQSVVSGGSLSATDFADLKTILNNAATLNMAGYVQVLAGDVINGNTANAHYQGQTLGNLHAGSSATQMTELVDKWFLGMDHPTLTSSSYGYQTVSGTLFPHTPSHTDEYQGMLGDCYFISSMGTIADSNAQAVQNMFINNGDNTYTVRFYANGTADYVTVDNKLPTQGGCLVYANYGATASNGGNYLWLALAEKAYAQWNETGNEGRDGQNAYGSIEGGWMSNVDAQVLGTNASNYSLTAGNKQALINAVNAHQAVTIGTTSNSANTTPYGLYASHAYAVIGYNATSDKFTLYNPWGFSQPGLLTYANLQTATTLFTVANPSGSVPISAMPVRAALNSAVETPIAEPAASNPHGENPPAAADAAATTSGNRAAAAAQNARLAALDDWNAHGAWESDPRTAHDPLTHHTVDAAFGQEFDLAIGVQG